MQQGVVAGYPVKDVGCGSTTAQYHSVDSSEMAFKIAGSMAFKDAMEQAAAGAARADHEGHACSVPEDAVGDVIGDLNSRRGRPLGMEPKGSMTEIKAEVPMAEMLSYAPDLRAITGAGASTRWSSRATRRCRRTWRSRWSRRRAEKRQAVKA